MTSTGDILQILQQTLQSGKLVNDLMKNELLNTEQADAFALALTDIAESADEVYRELVPRLLSSLAENKREDAREVLWEMREAFRHMDYHIHDAGLLDL